MILGSFTFRPQTSQILESIVLSTISFRVVTHFYGLIPLGNDQTAEEQYRLMKKRFEDDGTWTAIKANIVAFIVDG